MLLSMIVGQPTEVHPYSALQCPTPVSRQKRQLASLIWGGCHGLSIIDMIHMIHVVCKEMLTFNIFQYLSMTKLKVT